MADTSQGEGWWQASDLRWYPPELHADPEHRARHEQRRPQQGASASAPPTSTPPVPAQPTRAAQPDPVVEMPPPGVAPGPRFEPIPAPHDAPAPTPRPRRSASPPPANQSRRGLLFAGVGVALVGLTAAVVFLLAGSGDDDPDDANDTSPTPAVSSNAETATPIPRQGALPGIDVTTSGVGTADDPAAFGEVYGWPEWRGSVIEVVDAVEAGLVAEFDDPPAQGRSHLAVIYEASYVGDDISAFEPFLIDTPGTTIDERFACILDTAALDAIDVSSGIFELVPGQTVRLAVCLEIATEAAGDLVVSLDNVNVFGDPVVFGPSGSLLEPLDPPPFEASRRSLRTVPYGTLLEDEGWQGTVVEVFDAGEAGVVSEFASEPADGMVFLVVVAQVTNATNEDAEFIPIRVTGIGSAVYEGFNSCFLDADAMDERDVEINRFELASGETVRVATCLEVPSEDLASLVVRMQNSFSGNGVFVLYPGGG